MLYGHPVRRAVLAINTSFYGKVKSGGGRPQTVCLMIVLFCLLFVFCICFLCFSTFLSCYFFTFVLYVVKVGLCFLVCFCFCILRFFFYLCFTFVLYVVEMGLCY